MASSTPQHSRSNSLPIGLSLTVSHFEEQLNRIRSSESASSSASSSISSKLSRLSDLYDCVDDLLQLPSSQKAFSCQGNEKLVEDALEGSIKLLDVCGIISDVLTQMKEHVQELQSIMRRRCSEDEISKEVAQYLKTKRTAIKAVFKALKDLKKMENMYATESCEVSDMSCRLRDCQMVSLSMLQSILVSIAGPKACSQRSSWELVISKLMKSKRANQQGKDLFFVGFETMDAALHQEKARNQLENMEICITEVEQGFQRLFRHLIKTRTTILNILNC